MTFENELRELVKKKGLRRVARDLDIDPASLYRSLQNGSNVTLGRIERLLHYFGYDLKIVKREKVGQSKLGTKNKGKGVKRA